MYDSSFTSLYLTTEKLIRKEFHPPGVETSISIVRSQRQKGDKDCGLFAIAHATSIVFGLHPAKQKSSRAPFDLTS